MANFKKYINDAGKELRKVSWPDRPKVVEMSLVVSGCTAVFTAYLWGVDVLITQAFKAFFF